jgi:hypothetical protein
VPVTLGLSDDAGGSGPGTADVLASRDGGAFALVGEEIDEPVFEFTGVVGSRYRFLVVPRDLTRNQGPLSAATDEVLVEDTGGGGGGGDPGGDPGGGGGAGPPAAGGRPTARAIDDSCPTDEVEPSDFEDVAADNAHLLAIDCAAWWDIAEGFTASRFGPGELVTRAQMASFIARLIDNSSGTLPEDPPDAFTDDDGSDHEANINRLAAAGIVTGRADGDYDPGDFVTRAQMATFIVRAYQFRTGETLPPDEDAFGESLTEPHATAIRQAAGAGFTGGLADGSYGSQQFVRRDQMASFLARVLDLLVETGFTPTPG